MKIAVEFEMCEAKVVAIRSGNEFVQEAKEGQKCLLILDRTCFYAEQGGQIFDQGFITANGTYGTEVNFIHQNTPIYFDFNYWQFSFRLIPNLS